MRRLRITLVLRNGFEYQFADTKTDEEWSQFFNELKHNIKNDVSAAVSFPLGKRNVVVRCGSIDAYEYEEVKLKK